MHTTIILILLIMVGSSAGCALQSSTISSESVQIVSNPLPAYYDNMGAGFRYSSYGVDNMPEDDYWIHTGKLISSKLKGSTPEAVWIVGEITSTNGVRLTFPSAFNHPLIEFSPSDRNEKLFDQFDKEGFNIWLQVEPGDVDLVELIQIIFNQYGHHRCIVGFGVDVEWYKISINDEGKGISDEEARQWIAAIKRYNTNYKLFLKHWLTEKMPPTERTDIVFINDGQEFSSLDAMIQFFTNWASFFYPSRVGFQFGYPSDKKWWSHFDDPFLAITREIVTRSSNVSSVYWVDFSILEVFPIQKKQ